MEFCIHDVKNVIELYDEKQVNDYIKCGWVLLSVGFETHDKHDYEKTYILGNVDRDALNSSSDNPFNKFVKKS